MPAPTIHRGADELRHLLRERTADVRALSVGGFREWLEGRVESWRHDPVFVQRCRIRDVRRAHPEIRAAEKAARRARGGYERSPEFAELSRIEKAMEDAAKAVAGLTAAADAEQGEERRRLAGKRDGFVAREAALRSELADAVARSASRRAWEHASAEARAVRTEAGIDALEAELAEIVRERGQRSGRQGTRFEDVALAVTRGHLLPEMAAACGCGAEELRILHGVTLGAAGIELDQVIVRCASAEADADVVALVEAKRSLNDIAHGFRQRQQNLAWLTGDRAGYDAGAHRTRAFPTGHFDRSATHTQDGEAFHLSSGSFRRFTGDPATGLFIAGLYFITRPGWMWGAGPAALTRLSHRIATDEAWDPADDGYLADLLRWTCGMTEPVEAPDVLRLYASGDVTARQVVLVDSDGLT